MSALEIKQHNEIRDLWRMIRAMRDLIGNFGEPIPQVQDED